MKYFLLLLYLYHPYVVAQIHINNPMKPYSTHDFPVTDIDAKFKINDNVPYQGCALITLFNNAKFNNFEPQASYAINCDFRPLFLPIHKK